LILWHRTRFPKVLEPYREIAGVLGTTVSEYVQWWLERSLEQTRKEGLAWMAQEVEARSYRNRAVAEGIAERFEVFAVEAKLQVRPNTGTIATRLVQADDGYRSVLTDYLSPSAKRGWPIGIS
jgi:hypothetical protein